MQYPDAKVIHPKPSMLPWILFALVFVGGIGAVLVEEQKLDAASRRVAASTRSEERARIEVGEATSAKHALETRVHELQTENGRLTVKVAAARVEPSVVPAAHATKKARKKKHHKHSD